MTAQFSEKLTYQGEQLALCTEPLVDYFVLSNKRPDFKSPSTALWRGYVGSWEIIGDRLYLIAIDGVLKNGSEITLESIFPGYRERVFSHWYSGTLRIPQGQLLQYVHMGYGSKYEQDLMINIKKGVVCSKRINHNGISDNKGITRGYGVGAFTLFSKKQD